MAREKFKDRFEGGRILAERLGKFAHQDDVVVLALPRGGVPVAFEIARALRVRLDVFLVRKLGVPGHPELAMGAIATGGVCVLNDEVIQYFTIPPETIATVAAEERRELDRRERKYRNGRAPVEAAFHHVILVDDGLATGASMRAAVRALRPQKPVDISVAVPVGTRTVCAELEEEADEVVCALMPAHLHAVGEWYEDFQPVTDEQVIELLERAAERPAHS